MVESDDEFTELCTKLLKRVKRRKASEGQSTSTASKNKIKKPKPSKAKSKSSNGASKETEGNINAGDGLEKASNELREAASTVPALLSNGHTDRGN